MSAPQDTPRPIISVKNVSKRFPGVTAVDNVSFDINENEFFALLGPSGCGKTTLLRMIAGLETVSEGEILIDGQVMGDTPPNQRPVNMVFQSYAVFPHMSVLDNVAYGLKVTGVARGEREQRAREALDMVQLGDLGERKPDQLSGGQRQRVALARALVKRPRVLLLDEPLSALDAKLREQMQLELSRLQQNVGITFIIVTHDQDEALSMADRIAVMEKGVVRQIATPDKLYESPVSRFVADFIGKVNLIEAKPTGRSGSRASFTAACLGKFTLPVSGEIGEAVTLAVRPEKVRLSKTRPRQGGLSVRGVITDWAYYGADSHMIVTTAGGETLSVFLQNASRTSVDAVDIGDDVWLAWSEDDTIILTE